MVTPLCEEDPRWEGVAWTATLQPAKVVDCKRHTDVYKITVVEKERLLFVSSRTSHLTQCFTVFRKGKAL